MSKGISRPFRSRWILVLRVLTLLLIALFVLAELSLGLDASLIYA